MTTTQTLVNRRFELEGESFEVLNEREVGKNLTGFTGLGETVRTFVRSTVTGEEFECEPGCSFQGERVVRESRG